MIKFSLSIRKQKKRLFLFKTVITEIYHINVMNI